jgi:hypothetical protein
VRVELPSLAKEIFRIQTIQLYAGNNFLLIAVIFDNVLLLCVCVVIPVEVLCFFYFCNTSFRESTEA